MKTAVILFKEDNGKFPIEKISKITSSLALEGFGVSTVEVLDYSNDLGFNRRLHEFKDVVDNLIILYDENLTFDIKGLIAEEFESVMVENENALKILDKVSKLKGENFAESYALLPMGATLIPNEEGAFQGFMIEENEFTLAVISGEEVEGLKMCNEYVLPYLETKYDVSVERVVLKMMGDLSKASAVVEESKNIYNDEFEAVITEKNKDVRIELIFDNQKCRAKREVIRYVMDELKDDVYAEFDTTPAQRLFDIIKLKGLTLSTAESFTAGRLASTFIENSGASAFFNEGIVAYSNASKIDRLGVNALDLKREGAVSSVVAYQMALGLLKRGNCDIAISTTGIAGPKSDDTSKPVGLCFMSVGLKDGVHTYKFNFNGTREEITETAVNMAQFLAIKILKRI